MLSGPAYVDLRLRAEGLGDVDLETLAGFGLRAAVLCAHRPPGPRDVDLRRHWDELSGTQSRRLAAAGIRPLVALGVPGAHIPARGLSVLLHDLTRRFGDPSVVAFGELDLAAGGPREESLLEEQLGLARDLDRPVLLRAPAGGGLRATQRLLSMVRRAGPPPERFLLVGAQGAPAELARALGLWHGWSVGTSAADDAKLVGLVRARGGSRLALVSDVGDGAGDLVALPRAIHGLAKAGLSEKLLRGLLHDGPLAFVEGSRARWAHARAAGRE
jgi:predicted metal-dependent TIM-barrel fold hydrolase